MSEDKVVAVVLSGCGVFDGSEIHEASAVCVALSRHGYQPVFYAPDKKLFHEINHVSGADGDSDRNILVEAGRIARGKVRPLSELTAESASGVIFPGGFGAAKNLCTFATSSDPSVDPEVERVLKEFHEAKKVIGMCCIASIIAAMVFGRSGIKVKLTLGSKGEGWPYGDTIDKARDFGADPIELDIDGICIDEDNKLVTTPAFMFEGPFYKIHDGVAKMVEKVVELI